MPLLPKGEGGAPRISRSRTPSALARASIVATRASCLPLTNRDTVLVERPALRSDDVSALTQSICVVWMCLLIGAELVASVVPASGMTR